MLKNKARCVTVLLTLALTPLLGEPMVPTQTLIKSLDIEPAEDEIVTIERLLVATEKQLACQKQIKNLMTRFKDEKELFMKGESSKLHARYMISTASQMHRLICNHGMERLFASDFLEELALFTAIGKKERVDVRNQIH